MAENYALPNYFTEKIIDAILSECLIFYWGCPNITSFLDPRSYIVVDLKQSEGHLGSAMEKSYELIQTSIKNNEWEKRIEYIRKEKKKILNNYSFFPRIDSLINFSKLNIYAIYSNDTNYNNFLTSAEKENLITNTRTIRKYNDYLFPGNSLILKDTHSIKSNFIDHLSVAYYKILLDYPSFEYILLISNKTNHTYPQKISHNSQVQLNKIRGIILNENEKNFNWDSVIEEVTGRRINGFAYYTNTI